MTDGAFTAGSFGDLLRQILVREQQRTVAQIAAALRVTPRSFYARMRGSSRFSPDEIVILLREITDERLARWLFVGSSLLLVRRPMPPNCDPDKSLFRAAVSGAEQVIAALLDSADAFERSTLRREQMVGIEEHIDRAQAELLWLKLQLAADRAGAPATADSLSHDGFAPLIDQVLLMEKGIRLRDLADALGLTYDAIRARARGGVAFTPAELKLLFRSYPDPRLADYLLSGTTYITVPRPGLGDSSPGYSPLRAGLLSLREMIKLLGALQRTKGTPDFPQPAVVGQTVDEALRQLATL